MSHSLQQTFSTFVLEIPKITPDRSQRFIAIATEGNLPIEEVEVVTAVEGWVFHTILNEKNIQIDVKSGQLQPKPNLPGEYIYNA